MDPHETVAEKILGWCAHRLVKHYADLGYIALVSRPDDDRRLIDLSYPTVREVLAAKLETMRNLQPGVYAAFPHLDAVVGDLSRPPQLDRSDWERIMYVRSARDRFKLQIVTAAVMKLLVPGLRRAARR